MPFRQQSSTHLGANRNSSLTLLTEQGYLRSCSLSVSPAQESLGGRGITQLYGELYLSSTETPVRVPIVLLASGYFGSTHHVAWFGHHPLEPSSVILAYIHASVDALISLYCWVER